MAKAKEEAEAKANAAQKDVEFYKNFNIVSAKYQGANEYQDKIREKVMSGYDVEDAMISILAKEGKFQGMPTPTPEREMAAGGSAPTAMAGSGGKSVDEMSKDEKRAALEEAFGKGDLKLS